MKSNIVEKFNQLPPDLHEEVKVSKRKKELKLDWAGSLKEFRDQYTALELQKKALGRVMNRLRSESPRPITNLA